MMQINAFLLEIIIFPIVITVYAAWLQNGLLDNICRVHRYANLFFNIF